MFRRPLVWIILIILGAVIAGSLLTGGSDYVEVDTVVSDEQIADGNVETALLKNKEQIVELDLAEPIKVNAEGQITDDGEATDKIQAFIPAEATEEVWTAIRENTDDYNTEVTQENLLVAFLINLLPIAIIVILLLLFMSQMQGGGSRVMNFGKSKAKQITKDTPKTTFEDVAGAGEAIEELQEIKDFLQNPAKYQALGAKIPKGVLLFGPEPVRLCWRELSRVRPVCRSTRSAVPTSWKCSSVSVPAVSVTCLRRQRRTLRRSCSSMRSTPSVVTVERAWAEATTSVSRR